MINHCAHIDYISVTYHTRQVIGDVVFLIFRRIFGDVELESLPGRHFYTHCLHYGGFRIYYDGSITSKKDYFTVQVSGEGCYNLEEIARLSGVSHWLSYLHNICVYYKYRITRLDICKDYFNGQISLTELFKCWESDNVKTLFRKCSFIGSFSPGSPAELETLYFGSPRSSDSFVRVYDKEKEQKDYSHPRGWIRLEIVLKNDVSDYFTDIIRDWQFIDLDKIYKDYLYKYLRFGYTRGSDKEFEIFDWWKSVIDGGERIVYKSKTELNYDKRFAWLKKSVAKTFALVADVYDGNLGVYLYEEGSRKCPQRILSS